MNTVTAKGPVVRKPGTPFKLPPLREVAFRPSAGLTEAAIAPSVLAQAVVALGAHHTKLAHLTRDAANHAVHMIESGRLTGAEAARRSRAVMRVLTSVIVRKMAENLR